MYEADPLCQHGLDESELKRAKAKIVGHKKIARQDLGSYAKTTALDERYGLGYANCDTEDNARNTIVERGTCEMSIFGNDAQRRRRTEILRCQSISDYTSCIHE